MARRFEPLLGFTAWIEVRLGLPCAAEAAFARRLEDYLSERDLIASAGPLDSLISSPDRSLSATDQVDFLDWLADEPVVCTVILSPLVQQLDRPAEKDTGFVRACLADPVVIALKTLYRCRRVNAELYLQLLGGFVRPVLGP